jgi:hypothetical protein
MFPFSWIFHYNNFEYKFIGKKSLPDFEISKQELYVQNIKALGIARVEATKGELARAK